MRRAVVALAVVVAVIPNVPAHGAATEYRAGGRSMGDALFPQLGNTGYDAQHYELALSYTPVAHMLSGTSTMTAVATDNLREFSLDFQGFTISALTVNGKAAKSSRADTKLVITPDTPLDAGSTFTVAVTYSGEPPSITDPDGSSEGWLRTYDGAFVVGEPMGAQGWFPCNNHPRDKATYDETVTVPIGLSVIGNGELIAHSDNATAAQTTWHWRESEPMASYLTTVTLGNFRVTTSTTTKGVHKTDAVDQAYPPHAATGPIASVVAPASTADVDGQLARQPDMIDFFERLYGPYPFSATGGIVAVAPDVGYALETQTKPVFPLPPSTTTVAHETSHQWYGDSVSLAQWRDIWLNEGFATESEHLYMERRAGGPTAASIFAANAAKAPTDSYWSIPPADPPTAADIFASQVYSRGGDTLEGLREVVGDAAFARVMTTWATDHRYGWGTTQQFVDLALQLSGTSGARRGRLADFLDQWLHKKGKPTVMPADVLAASNATTVVAGNTTSAPRMEAVRGTRLPATGAPLPLASGLVFIVASYAARSAPRRIRRARTSV